MAGHDSDCVGTFQQTRDALMAIERQLAVKLDIRGNVRVTLLDLARRGKLREDELVADWHDHYASYLDWTRNESWNDPPKKTADDRDQGAAQAALLLLWIS